MMIVILGQIDFHVDDLATARATIWAMADETSSQPGCLNYAFAARVSAPNRFQLTERWRDEAALSAS